MSEPLDDAPLSLYTFRVPYCAVCSKPIDKDQPSRAIEGGMFIHDESECSLQYEEAVELLKVTT